MNPIDDPWDVEIGDSFTGQATFNESLVPATGTYAAGLFSDPGFSLSFNVGTMQFDLSFAPFGFFTSILFNNGSAEEFILADFIDSLSNPQYQVTLSTSDFHTLNTANERIYEGTITFGEPTKPIPEPTAMLLFGSGLIGLAGFRGKIKK